MMKKQIKTKGKRLGFIAGVLLGVNNKGKRFKNTYHLSSEFKTSTQHIGVNFSNKIRKVFRSRWLKFNK